MKIYDISVKFHLVQECAEIPRSAASAAEVVRYMVGAFDQYPEQETFWVLFLTRKNTIRGRQMITLGLQSATLAHPREVFRAAIVKGAAAIVCCHNHPSGDPSPSAADLQMTRQLREASRAVDIPMQDHVIIGTPECDPLGKGYYSFRNAGLL